MGREGRVPRSCGDAREQRHGAEAGGEWRRGGLRARVCALTGVTWWEGGRDVQERKGEAGGAVC